MAIHETYHECRKSVRKEADRELFFVHIKRGKGIKIEEAKLNKYIL